MRGLWGTTRTQTWSMRCWTEQVSVPHTCISLACSFPGQQGSKAWLSLQMAERCELDLCHSGGDHSPAGLFSVIFLIFTQRPHKTQHLCSDGCRRVLLPHPCPACEQTDLGAQWLLAHLHLTGVALLLAAGPKAPSLLISLIEFRNLDVRSLPSLKLLATSSGIAE